MPALEAVSTFFLLPGSVTLSVGTFGAGQIVALCLALLCLMLSGFVSGSEMAYFSLSEQQLEELERQSARASHPTPAERPSAIPGHHTDSQQSGQRHNRRALQLRPRARLRRHERGPQLRLADRNTHIPNPALRRNHPQALRQQLQRALGRIRSLGAGGNLPHDGSRGENARQVGTPREARGGKTG